jgi:hypothetical protein
MIARQIILTIIGFGGGLVVAGGVFAFIVGLGIITRYAGITHTAHNLFLYEDCVFLGSIFGNLLFLYNLSIPFGEFFSGMMGLFFGIFVGSWSVALAEIVNIFPIFSRRINLTKGTKGIVISMAISKVIGSFIYFYKRF